MEDSFLSWMLQVDQILESFYFLPKLISPDLMYYFDINVILSVDFGESGKSDNDFYLGE